MITETYDFLEFLDKRDNFIICEFIKQHKYAAELYDKTTNTIRIITLRQPKNHKFKIFFAVQRIGTSNTIPVDNGSRGGLVSKINLDTGELSEAKTLKSMEVFYDHPDSGARIAGVYIPDWEKIKEKVLSVAEKLPYMDFIAWDILVTEKGPYVVEANSSSGVNILQLWGGQRNSELGDFFRYYGVIK